jgi:hypothetical protein
MKGSLIRLPLHRTWRHRTTMMPCAAPAITPPPVLRQNWETLAWLALWWSKPPNVGACPHTVFICSSVLRHKPTNLLPHGFESHIKKPSLWFYGPNHQIAAASFEALTGKPTDLGFEAQPRNLSTMALRLDQETRRPWCWGSTRKSALLVSLCTVQSAHSVTWPLDHPTTKYPTYAWPTLVPCTRSPTPATILVTARHVAPITNTPQDKQTWFSTPTYRGKTTEISQIWIQTKASQWLITIKPRYWPLGFSVTMAMDHMGT